ncbi:MAG: SUF system NifU family Fe-S cluster assembly protein, partial [Lachnospiraceae bacterium]|nr:SUF system NifU family Fe-S cluster assembly protein [Lachnospiraceae bacterium]
KVEDGKIVDGAYEGDGCAISQASADMMLDLVIGKSKDEAQRLADIFLRMIKGTVTEEEMEELEEASILSDVSHMPARVKCAVLGWHTMQEMLEEV